MNPVEALDRRLMAAPRRLRVAVMVLTAGLMATLSLPNVPRQYVDYAQVPLLSGISQRDTYGTDTLSDMYGARVVMNDPMDMFTKAKLDQTPQEAATWTKEASAPYPPAVLLTEAALYRIGDWTGAGFYGVILFIACAFLALSALYFWRTRWYLFPLLYLNFTYFSERFVYVQDSTYLIMLIVVMGALFLARAGRTACHACMAVAITMKLSPLYYVKNIFGMPRTAAWLFAGIVFAGLVLPYFVWENYLYIYRYANELKGDWNDAAGALAVAGPVALTVWYVETRLGFDLEDRVGWGLVPFALFLGLKMNVARHLLIVLLVPDKRAIRNVAAAVALAVPALLPVPFNAALPVATAILVLGLVYYLNEIGWTVVREDMRHPRRTLRMMLTEPSSVIAGRR